MAPTDDDNRPGSPTPSQLPPVPDSPVHSIASTANPISQFSLPLPPAPRPAHARLSKADIENSHVAYSDLLASAKNYRQALASLSTAASAFGSALEACARLKEARAEPIGPPSGTSLTASFTTKGACTADTLMSASGIQHLVANHQQILSETVYRSFEVPLLHDLDKWQTVIDDEEETYQQQIKAQSKEVKRLEKEGLKLHKQRRRDVARFRAHLVELTNKLDGLTTLHANHSHTLLREGQETSGRIADASCSLVRAEIDIFESLAKKGWTGGGLEDVLEKGQDLFATEDVGAAGTGGGHGNTDGVKLFSILPAKSILADSTSEGSRPHHARGDSLLVDTERYQSLSAVASDVKPGDNESVFSADFNKPRNARPFSPQPIRRVPIDVTAAAAALGGTQDEDQLKSRNPDIKEVEEDNDPEESKQTANQEEPDEEEERGRKWEESPKRKSNADIGSDESSSDVWSQERHSGK